MEIQQKDNETLAAYIHHFKTAAKQCIHYAPYQATAAAHAILWLMGSPITTHAMTYLTIIVTPHPAVTTSPTDVTCTTVSQTGATLAPATPTTLHRNHSQDKPSHFQDLQSPPKTPPFQDSPSRISLHNLPQIQTAILIL